jgi:hypothetical protein
MLFQHLVNTFYFCLIKMDPLRFKHLSNRMMTAYAEVPIWVSHKVDLHWVPVTQEEGMEIIHDTLKIILPYLGLRRIVASIVEVLLQDHIDGQKGVDGVHGRTTIFYCKKRATMVATIQLNRTSLLNSDALISTLLHEMSHLVHATTISTCLKSSVLGCGGHDDKFCEINAMLVMMFKNDLRSRSMILDLHSNVYDVSRFVEFSMKPIADAEFNMLPKTTDHASESLDRIQRSKRPKKMKGQSKESRAKCAVYNIY